MRFHRPQKQLWRPHHRVEIPVWAYSQRLATKSDASILPGTANGDENRDTGWKDRARHGSLRRAPFQTKHGARLQIGAIGGLNGVDPRGRRLVQPGRIRFTSHFAVG